MRGAQTIRRMGSARSFFWASCAVAWVALSSGCGARRRRPPHQREPQSVSSVDSALDSSASEAPPILAPIAQAITDVREQKLEIFPPRDDTPRIALGKGRLAQAAADKIIFRDTRDGAVIAESELGTALAVTKGVDGSLIALGLTEGARLAPQTSKPRSFPHVAFFPGAALFPDLTDPSHFYVFYGGQQALFHYAFEAEAGSFLPIEDRFPLEGCVGPPALLRDGAFLCSTADGIERRAPRGREARFKLPAGVSVAIRLLPAKRLDELFSVSETGEVVHLRLQLGLPVLGRFQLPASPFAAVGNAEALAFVLVNRPAPGSPRRFTLLVTDLAGQERYKVDLPSAAASAGEDWLKGVIGDKNLAISEFEPLVAVGGADSVAVWDYARGASVFTR
jgi:hypothetical protein